MINSSLRSLRQVNLFNGMPERRAKPKKKVKPKATTQEKYEKSLQAKKLVRNFYENQMLLPVITVVNSVVGKQKLLPVLPDEIFNKSLPDLITQHRAFKLSDGIDNTIERETLRRSTFNQNWTDNDILIMHSELLHESMMVLTYEGVPDDKKDVIAWIFAEDILIWHNRRVKAVEIPFSFQACCMLCQMDYTILQDYVYAKLTPEYKQLIKYKMAA